MTLVSAFNEVMGFQGEPDEAVSILLGVPPEEYDELSRYARPMLLAMLMQAFTITGDDDVFRDAVADENFAAGLGSSLLASMDVGMLVGAVVAREATSEVLTRSDEPALLTIAVSPARKVAIRLGSVGTELSLEQADKLLRGIVLAIHRISEGRL